MKNTKPNAEQVWKQFEDIVVPRLRLNIVDRAVYSHLLRHSRLEGKVQLQFSILGLARHIGLSGGPTREAVRRLVGHGGLRLVERSKAGHTVEVRLPEEIRALRPYRIESLKAAKGKGTDGGAEVGIEEADFLQTRTLRKAIHAREGGRCFYCLRRITPTVECLDHVVPRALSGRNSYRNLVSSCMECNSHKGERSARDFLRWLYRDGRLTADELRSQLRALDDLASGKLRPLLPATAKAAAKEKVEKEK
jgi:hypothetical protein